MRAPPSPGHCALKLPQLVFVRAGHYYPLLHLRCSHCVIVACSLRDAPRSGIKPPLHVLLPRVVPDGQHCQTAIALRSPCDHWLRRHRQAFCLGGSCWTHARSPTTVACCIRSSTLANQKLHDGGMTIRRSEMKRCTALEARRNCLCGFSRLTPAAPHHHWFLSPQQRRWPRGPVRWSRVPSLLLGGAPFCLGLSSPILTRDIR